MANFGTTGTHLHDFYVDVDGTKIAHPRTSPEPSPYASFYNSGISTLIFFDASVTGWRFASTNSTFAVDDWLDGPAYFQPDDGNLNHILGWETLGGTSGQYPSGQAYSEEYTSVRDYGTAAYEVTDNVPALFQFGSVVDGSFNYPSEPQTQAIVLFTDTMRINTLATNHWSVFNNGVCVKPLNQESCQSDSCDKRTVIHVTADNGQMDVSFSHGSD